MGIALAAALVHAQGTQSVPLPLSGRAPQAGSITATQQSQPGNGVNTLLPTLNASGAYAGGIPAPQPFNGRLSLQDAIARGLAYNLGAAQWSNTVRQAEGQSRVARSALLPNLNSSLSEVVQQTDLKATGIRFNAPLSGIGAGFSFPTVVGPFSYMQLQASLTQSIFNFTSWDNYRASQQTLLANRDLQFDAQDQVVLGVGGAYLGVLAAQDRLEAARAQLDTANAILARSQQQQSVGAVPQLTVNQNQVQASIQQLQLTTLQNDVDKRKINLARMIGLPPQANFTLTDHAPFAPPPPLTLTEALTEALAGRSDLKAAAAQSAAARQEVAAARGERLPSANLSGNYGVLGTSVWESSHGVFTLNGTINLPLWQGGRVGGDLQQAEAALAQRQAEEQDLRSQIEAEIREAYLDLNAAASEVKVAQNNLQVAEQTLSMTRDRFQAGVINTVELIQAQQQLALAQQDFINSVYAHNVAKLTLARELGGAAKSWNRFVQIQP